MKPGTPKGGIVGSVSLCRNFDAHVRTEVGPIDSNKHVPFNGGVVLVAVTECECQRVLVAAEPKLGDGIAFLIYAATRLREIKLLSLLLQPLICEEGGFGKGVVTHDS